MKINSAFVQRPRSAREGSSVLIVLVLLAFMVVLTAANTATVNRLRDRVKIVDQRQTRRLAACSTNLPHIAAPATNQPQSK
ncbi:MAG: hypothetical protein ACLQVY_29485 [Limisphaerales bacterium]